MDKKTIKERSNMLLTKMALTEDAKRVTAKYSGGMKRRLSLALALIHDPQIAFLDEPTVAMDPQSRHAVWDFIKEQKTKGKTIILTTHYMEEAEELCDRSRHNRPRQTHRIRHTKRTHRQKPRQKP